MRHATGLLCVLAISSLASAETGGGARPAPTKAPPPKLPQPVAPATLSETSKMLEPIQVESLTLTPLVTTKQKIDDEKQLVLDEPHFELPPPAGR